MEVNGRERRLRRLFCRHSGRSVLLPIDQPVTLGPIRGLTAIDDVLPELLAGEPDALIAHRGVLRRIPANLLGDTSMVMHLSSGTALSGRAHAKVLTGTVAEAVRLGADAVSVQVSFGRPDESVMLADLAATADACVEYGMPVLAMVYVRAGDPASLPGDIAHAARAAAEMGADVVKVPWTGSAETFAGVVEGCFAPVVVAGGEKGSWDELRTAVKDALDAGAAGACVGRNVFQHKDVKQALTELRATVHGSATTNFADVTERRPA